MGIFFSLKLMKCFVNRHSRTLIARLQMEILVEQAEAHVIVFLLGLLLLLFLLRGRSRGGTSGGSSANTRPNVGDQGLEVSGLQSLREEARPVRLYLDTSSLKDGGDLLGGDGDIIVSENEGGVNAGKLGVGHLLRFD